MIAVRCSHDRAQDGSYLLRLDALSDAVGQRELSLQGSEADVWEAILDFAGLPGETQREVMHAVSPELRQAFVDLISRLAGAGFLEADAEFCLDAIAPPQAPPLHKLHLEITHRCNFRCGGCYIGDNLLPATGTGRNEGTTEQWLKLIADAARLGCGHATVTGGEPFLRADILTLLAALTEHRIETEINTNASCISRQTARSLRSFLISGVEVTLYGHSDSSASEYTGVRLGHKAAMRGIQHLVDNHIPTSVKIFATRWNESFLDEARNQLSTIDVPVRVTGHTIHGDLFQGKMPAGAHLAKSLDRPPVVQNTPLPCYPSVNGLGIEPNGRIRACPKLTVYFGNAFEDGLESVWKKSKQLAAFRGFWIEYCKVAGYVRGANHGSLCPAAGMLSRPGGSDKFRNLWKIWLVEGRLQ